MIVMHLVFNAVECGVNDFVLLLICLNHYTFLLYRRSLLVTSYSQRPFLGVGRQVVCG